MFKLACFLLLAFVIHAPMVAAATLAEGVNALEQKRYAEALEIFVPLANAGDSEAQRRLGEMAYNGQGVKRNFEAASKWNELAAAGGDRIAMYNLGYLYERGEGVAKNLDTSIDWYQKSANQNYAEAQYRLGALYEQKRNRDLALSWYEKAFKQGHVLARQRFGDLGTTLSQEENKRQQEERSRQAEREAAMAPYREQAEERAKKEVAEREVQEERQARKQERAERKERQAKADHDKDFQDTLNMIRDAGNNARASIEQVDAQNQRIYAITQAAKRREEEEEHERQREQRHERQEESSAAMAGSGRTVNGNSTGNASNYSSDSPSASQLDKICKSVCSQYVADCDKPGAQSACHSASACTFRCFANNAPNHPDRSEWLRQATKEDEIVRSYRYDGPTFSSEPSRQIYQPPPQPAYIPTQPKRGAGRAY